MLSPSEAVKWSLLWSPLVTIWCLHFSWCFSLLFQPSLSAILKKKREGKKEKSVWSRPPGPPEFISVACNQRVLAAIFPVESTEQWWKGHSTKNPIDPLVGVLFGAYNHRLPPFLKGRCCTISIHIVSSDAFRRTVKLRPTKALHKMDLLQLDL